MHYFRFCICTFALRWKCPNLSGKHLKYVHLKTHWASHTMHQNHAIILCQFNCGKKSFIVLIHLVQTCFVPPNQKLTALYCCTCFVKEVLFVLFPGRNTASGWTGSAPSLESSSVRPMRTIQNSENSSMDHQPLACNNLLYQFAALARYLFTQV